MMSTATTIASPLKQQQQLLLRWLVVIVVTLLASIIPVNAYVVTTTSSSRLSFVPKTVQFYKSSPYNNGYQSFSTSSTTRTTRSSTTTALSMNLFDRFTRVVNSNLNNILKNLEDPEKIMNQALEDMQGDLVKVRQSYAEVTATQRRLLKQKEQADAMAEDWYRRAQLALQAGNEGLAREALSRRQQQIDQAKTLQDQITLQANSLDKLYEGMQLLESKILESKSKKEQMVARARTAQSTQKINDMLGGMTGKTSMDAFKRMEEKVEALEAAAEVATEMGSNANILLPGSSASSIEQQFKLLEGSAAVDDELKKLKGLLNPSSSTTTTSSSSSNDSSSGSAWTQPPSNAALDDELEQLKKQAGL